MSGHIQIWPVGPDPVAEAKHQATAAWLMLSGLVLTAFLCERVLAFASYYTSPLLRAAVWSRVWRSLALLGLLAATVSLVINQDMSNFSRWLLNDTNMLRCSLESLLKALAASMLFYLATGLALTRAANNIMEKWRKGEEICRTDPQALVDRFLSQQSQYHRSLLLEDKEKKRKEEGKARKKKEEQAKGKAEGTSGSWGWLRWEPSQDNSTSGRKHKRTQSDTPSGQHGWKELQTRKRSRSWAYGNGENVGHDTDSDGQRIPPPGGLEVDPESSWAMHYYLLRHAFVYGEQKPKGATEGKGGQDDGSGSASSNRRVYNFSSPGGTMSPHHGRISADIDDRKRGQSSSSLGKIPVEHVPLELRPLQEGRFPLRSDFDFAHYLSLALAEELSSLLGLGSHRHTCLGLLLLLAIGWFILQWEARTQLVLFATCGYLLLAISMALEIHLIWIVRQLQVRLPCTAESLVAQGDPGWQEEEEDGREEIMQEGAVERISVFSPEYENRRGAERGRRRTARRGVRRAALDGDSTEDNDALDVQVEAVVGDDDEQYESLKRGAHLHDRYERKDWNSKEDMSDDEATAGRQHRDNEDSGGGGGSGRQGRSNARRRLRVTVTKPERSSSRRMPSRRGSMGSGDVHYGSTSRSRSRSRSLENGGEGPVTYPPYLDNPYWPQHRSFGHHLLQAIHPRRLCCRKPNNRVLPNLHEMLFVGQRKGPARLRALLQLLIICSATYASTWLVILMPFAWKNLQWIFTLFFSAFCLLPLLLFFFKYLPSVLQYFVECTSVEMMRRPDIALLVQRKAATRRALQVQALLQWLRLETRASLVSEHSYLQTYSPQGANSYQSRAHPSHKLKPFDLQLAGRALSSECVGVLRTVFDAFDTQRMGLVGHDKLYDMLSVLGSTGLSSAEALHLAALECSTLHPAPSNWAYARGPLLRFEDFCQCVAYLVAERRETLEDQVLRALSVFDKRDREPDDVPTTVSVEELQEVLSTFSSVQKQRFLMESGQDGGGGGGASGSSRDMLGGLQTGAQGPKEEIPSTYRSMLLQTWTGDMSLDPSSMLDADGLLEMLHTNQYGDVRLDDLYTVLKRQACHD
eukprot:g49700.t1